MKKRNKRILRGISLLILSNAADYYLVPEEKRGKDTTIPGTIFKLLGICDIGIGMFGYGMAAMCEVAEEVVGS